MISYKETAVLYVYITYHDKVVLSCIGTICATSEDTSYQTAEINHSKFSKLTIIYVCAPLLILFTGF